MLKKFLKLIKKNDVVKETVLPLENRNEELESNKLNEEIEYDNGEVLVELESEVVEEKIHTNIETEGSSTDVTISSSDLAFIKEAKIKRGMSIRAIDLYTKEEQTFKTHKECSKKLRIPMGYIKENLKYGYTDYLGEAIIYLNNELHTGNSDNNFDYLNNNKSPMELYNMLNNRIFTAKISEKKRDMILSNDKIEPIKMHYRFECLDEDYDDYFIKYKSIIQRGGKKKIELVDKKGEAIEIFKSLEECSTYLNKEKSQVVDMLKYGETKIGRYEIRYSLRSV